MFRLPLGALTYAKTSVVCLGSKMRSKRVEKLCGTTLGTRCPVRMTVAKRRFLAVRMCPITLSAEGHGMLLEAANSALPLQDMAYSAFRFPMWLQTEPSRTPLYMTTSLPDSSSEATTGADGRVKSLMSASATGPVSSALSHVTLPST